MRLEVIDISRVDLKLSRILTRRSREGKIVSNVVSAHKCTKRMQSKRRDSKQLAVTLTLLFKDIKVISSELS